MHKAALQVCEYYYKFQNIPAEIIAIISTRKLNVGFTNQTKDQIGKNRQVILSGLGLNIDQLVCCQQTHGNHVAVVESKDRGRGALNYQDAIKDTDALITKEKNIALSIFIADCLPVFLIDRNKNVVALAHCGWKSSQKSLLQKTIFAMSDEFGCKPEDIILFFGPAIRRCCLEVGEEFLNYFKDGLYPREGKIYLDLIEVNYLQAKQAGALEDNIFDSGICTFCQNNIFFSYRKERDSCGRQMALITRF